MVRLNSGNLKETFEKFSTAFDINFMAFSIINLKEVRFLIVSWSILLSRSEFNVGVFFFDTTMKNILMKIQNFEEISYFS